MSALSGSAEGRQHLKDGIRWDKEAGGYWVRLYNDGKEEWVLVTHVIDEGAATTTPEHGRQQGIESLYEAAVLQRYGRDGLWGNTQKFGIEILTPDRKIDTFYNNFFVDISDDVIEHGGSSTGKFATASTPDSFGGKGEVTVNAQIMTGRAPISKDIEIHADHAYVITDVTDDGLIGLSNPHGPGNDSDEGDTFYVTAEVFDLVFTEAYLEH
jgi:hypothetical protein